MGPTLRRILYNKAACIVYLGVGDTLSKNTLLRKVKNQLLVITSPRIYLRGKVG